MWVEPDQRLDAKTFRRMLKKSAMPARNSSHHQIQICFRPPYDRRRLRRTSSDHKASTTSNRRSGSARCSQQLSLQTEQSCTSDWLILIAERVHGDLPPALYRRHRYRIITMGSEKITQHAFAKLTLIKLKAPESHTVVAASYPDRQQALVGEE